MQYIVTQTGKFPMQLAEEHKQHEPVKFIATYLQEVCMHCTYSGKVWQIW